VIDHAGGSLTVGGTLFASDATAKLYLTGGEGDGQVIVTGTGISPISPAPAAPAGPPAAATT